MNVSDKSAPSLHRLTLGLISISRPNSMHKCEQKQRMKQFPLQKLFFSPSLSSLLSECRLLCLDISFLLYKGQDGQEALWGRLPESSKGSRSAHGETRSENRETKVRGEKICELKLAQQRLPHGATPDLHCWSVIIKVSLNSLGKACEPVSFITHCHR